jgi:glucose/arabinose dehydrogenase
MYLSHPGLFYILKTFDMKKIMLMVAIASTAFTLNAQTNILPEIVLVPFASELDNPVDIEPLGDQLFIVEQTGRIIIVDSEGNLVSVYLDLTDRVLSTGFEQGLLGLAFDPDYAENGSFYVHYTNLEGNNQFSRFSVDLDNPEQGDPNSEIPFLEDNDPFENHNSGQMKFGPDGYLYFTLGDGGSAGDPMNTAQNLNTIMGKLMRIDPNEDGTYSIPSDNPFTEVAGAKGEIWAMGLRNPWRFSFDKLTGDLWMPDVGQDSVEEINFQPAASPGGENYGWSCREGTHFFKLDCDDNGIPFTDPVAEYPHSTDTSLLCSGSVTGGYVYRGIQYPNMYGKYIYNDFCTGVMRTTYWDGSAWISANLGQYTPTAYSTFGELPDGELLLADKISGVIYKVTDVSTTAVETDLARLYDFQLTPNPNDGNYAVRFNSEQPESFTLNLYDYMGRKVWNEKRQANAGPNEWSFTNSELSTGYYYLHIQSPDGISALHFVTR